MHLYFSLSSLLSCCVMNDRRETWRLHFTVAYSLSCWPLFNFMAFLFGLPQAGAMHGHYTTFLACRFFELYLSLEPHSNFSRKLTVFQWLQPRLHNGIHYCSSPSENIAWSWKKKMTMLKTVVSHLCFYSKVTISWHEHFREHCEMHYCFKHNRITSFE